MTVEKETTREDWDRLQKQHPAIDPEESNVEASRLAATGYVTEAVREKLKADRLASIGGTPKEAREDIKGMTPDMVNHPSHYTYGKVECIDAIEESMSTEAFRGYCKGAAMKYLWRYERKGKPLEDLQKAQWYLVKLISSHQ